MEIKEYSSYWASITQLPSSSVYHSPDWWQVIQSTYGYTPRYILTREKDRVTGILPLFEINSWFSGRHLTAIPFSHHVTVLYENETILEALVDQAKQLASQRRCKYIEVRGSAKSLSRLGFQTSAHNLISHLDLKVPEKELWDNLHSSTRRNIRKASKNDLSVRMGRDRADFAHFYRLILETRRYQGVPPYPAQLFTALWMMPQSRLYLVCLKGRILAGMIVFCYGVHVIYAYGASVKDSEMLRMRPNDFLFWQVITDMRAENYETFDFGTTPIGNKELLHFKEKWGTQSKHLAYAYWLNTSEQIPIIQRDSKKVHLLGDVIRRMPLWSLQLMSRLLFRQLG